MPRHYLVDGYNVILQDPELDDLLDQEGLAAARRALRVEAEQYARQADCRIRLVYDGAVDPMSHDDRYATEYVEDSFTSRDEKADERLVALALEYRRRGAMVTIVSDDREGVRVPLESAGFALLGSAAFARLVRQAAGSAAPREKTVSPRDRDDLARLFLARDAEARARAASQPEPTEPARPSRSPALSEEPTRSVPPPVAPRPTAPVARPSPREIEAIRQREAEDAARAAKKERGARKQARRLEQQRRRSKG